MYCIYRFFSKTYILLVFGVLFLTMNVSAQQFSQTRIAISVGTGFPDMDKVFFRSDLHELTSFKDKGIAPIVCRVQYSFNHFFELAASFSYYKYRATWTRNIYNSASSSYLSESSYFNATSLSIMLRGNFHKRLTDRTDAYVGLGAGYKKTDKRSNEQIYTQPSFHDEIPIAIELTGGVRYYFTEKLGIYAELGWSKALIQFGATVRF